MTRINVIQIGLGVLLLGALGFGVFRLIGLDGTSSGIAAEAILILVVLAWTGSYLLRVFTGKMTFMEQRKRYRNAYEKITNAELQASFDSMTEEEQIRLIEELEAEKKSSNT